MVRGLQTTVYIRHIVSLDPVAKLSDAVDFSRDFKEMLWTSLSCHPWKVIAHKMLLWMKGLPSPEHLLSGSRKDATPNIIPAADKVRS